MNRVYNKVYKMILNDFVHQSQFERFYTADRFYYVMSPELVSDIVQKTIFDMGDEIKLREDAVLFLVINMHQMVVLPYLGKIFAENKLGYDLEQRLKEGEFFLERIISEDVEIIVRNATSISNRKTVTGGALLKALAKVYDKLGSAAENIWG